MFFMIPLLQHAPWGVCMDLAIRSYPNGTLDLPVLSRGYGTLVDQATHIDHAFM